MTHLLSSNNDAITNNMYCEIYVPMDYFTITGDFAINTGSTVETLGVLYIQQFNNGQPQGINLLSIPVMIVLNVYNSMETSINVNGVIIPCLALQYPPGSVIMSPFVTQGIESAELFLSYILGGKLPVTLDYADICELWRQNRELSNENFNVPSKTYEMIVATVYRNRNNTKQRFGQLYGKDLNVPGTAYKIGNIRKTVESLSTFSGMAYEAPGEMITTGINNTITGMIEPKSPLEKIIYY